MAEKKTFLYKIYQTNENFRFLPWDFLSQKDKKKVNPLFYKLVYSNEITIVPEKGPHEEFLNEDDCLQALEKIFYMFNMDFPSGYRGRSLSVSDVVVLKEEGIYTTKAFYCTSIGWKLVENWEKY